MRLLISLPLAVIDFGIIVPSSAGGDEADMVFVIAEAITGVSNCRVELTYTLPLVKLFTIILVGRGLSVASNLRKKYFFYYF